MSKLFDDASLAMIPSAYKDGKLYSIRPIPEYGAEEVTNGDFATDSDWTKGNGATISGGKANIIGDGSTYVSITQNSVFTTGKKYRVSVDVVINSGLGLKFQDGATNENIGFATSSGTYVFDFTAGANTSLVIGRRTGGTAFNSSVDNVSVKEVLVNGDFDFSRGSNLAATRVDVNGLIEKGRENLLLQSNQFDTTWTDSGANVSVTSGQSGYDNSTDAWLLDLDYTGGDAYLRQEKSISGVNTFSIYAKSGSADGIYIEFAAGNFPNIKVDLSDGSLISTNGTISTNIESVGNGWYRVSLSVNQSLARVNIRSVNGSGTNTTGTIYIQDAQLEAGLVATDYIETGASTAQAGILEDMPRLDYSGSCPALLLEPQRSNLVVQSEYFDGWNKISSPTITNNYGISPEGLRNSTRFQTSVGRLTQSVTTINANETFSIYMKGSGTLRMEIGSDNFYPSVTSEWVRYEFKTTQVGGNSNIQIRGNGSAVDVELYGAQYERNSYPTSYIPTYGSSVTRSNDGQNLQLDGVKTNGFFGNSYSIYFEFDNLSFGGPAGDFNYIYDTGNSVVMYVYGGTLAIHTDSGEQYTTFTQGFTDASQGKFLAKYDGNEVKIFKDGSLYRTYTNPSSRWDNPNFYRLSLSSSKATISYKNFMTFPTALTDSECIALTTL